MPLTSRCSLTRLCRHNLKMFKLFSKFSKSTKHTEHFVRYKHAPDHWSVLRKKNFPKDKALAHFDEFYANIFGEKSWKSIRYDILLKNKHAAVVNNYSDSERVVENLKSLGAINFRNVFNLRTTYPIKNASASKLQKEVVTSEDTKITEGEQESVSSLSANNSEASPASLKKKLADADESITDMTFHSFEGLCGKCWKNNKFVVIDEDSEMSSGIYQCVLGGYTCISVMNCIWLQSLAVEERLSRQLDL